MAIENFQPNTLIIPMDVTYQDNGMFEAYGLVYDLLKNGIPVKWAIQQGKLFDGADFSATTEDFQTGTSIGTYDYTGGPFIIDSTYEALAAPIITAWQVAHPNVVVHRAVAEFSADISATMNRAPFIAITDDNSSIATDYLDLAGIPDSNGNPWPNDSPDILEDVQVEAGALFGYNLEACRKIFYDIYIAPHDGGLEPLEAQEVDEYLRIGGMLDAMCKAIETYENTAGPFLTQSGMPMSDLNGGDDGTFTIVSPDSPFVQSVSTGQVQGLPGGSEQTWWNGEVTYNAQTQILAYFTEDDGGVIKQYDFMIAGPYKNGTGAGKIVYEGGHDYSPSIPYTDQDTNLYTRLFLDTVFFSVVKPIIYLERQPQILNEGIPNTITFSVVNEGGSDAVSTDFSVTLEPGVSYNGDATIPPTSITAQTLTWSSAALGDVPPGTILTFTADYTPTVLGNTSLANFDTSFGDNFSENYSFDNCVSASVQEFEKADLQAVKTVDKAYAEVGDVVTYTVNIANSGVLDATNILFQDIIPIGTSFVTDSVIVNTVSAPGVDPNTGFAIPDIIPTGSDIVTFQVTVIELVDPPEVINSATIDYSFTNSSGTFNSTAESDEATTQLEEVKVEFVKSVDKTAATIGDTLKYTVIITNTGTVAINNVIFNDAPPTGTIFNTGTFTIDGVIQSGEDPTVGVSLGSIAATGSITVTFDVTVDFIPDPTDIANVAEIDFIYRVDPLGPDIDGNAISNAAITNIEEITVLLKKTGDKDYVEVGDTLTYTVVITNTGTVDVQNIIFKDVVPIETSYVSESFQLNGIVVPLANPNIGVDIGNIAARNSATVSFQVTVNELPSSGVILNSSEAEFQYQISSGGPIETGNSESPEISTTVEEIILEVVKSASEEYVEVGDTLTFIIDVTNNGTLSISNVVLTDLLVSEIIYMNNTLMIDGVAQPGEDPTMGVSLGSISPGNTVMVSFDVQVQSYPLSGQFDNVASIDFDVQIPGELVERRSEQSNDITINVERAELQAVKSANKSVVAVGDTVIYSIIITNTGTVLAEDVVMSDLLPSETTFIPNTFTIEGTIVPGADPSTDINLGNIPAGDSLIITYEVMVDTLPEPPQISNTVNVSFNVRIDPNGPVETKSTESNTIETNVVEVSVEIVKNVDKSVATNGEELTYNIVITNEGTIPMNSVVLIDEIPIGTTFISDSLTINGVPSIGGNPSVGVNIGSIPAGDFAMVGFKVKIVSTETIEQVSNWARVNYKIQLGPNSPVEDKIEDSNTVITEIEKAELTLLKSVDKEISDIGEIIKYSILVSNTGTVAAEEIILYDILPKGTSFVENSIFVRGVQQLGVNPESGVEIGTIEPNGKVLVSFEVKVEFIPCPPMLLNTAEANFQYTLETRQGIFNGTALSNEVETDVGLKVFKQISIDGNLQIPIQKPDAEDILDSIVSVFVATTTLIKTPIGKSYEGQNLTGWKVIVQGKLLIKIKYVADEATQSVHVAHYEVPFSTFLVLPEDFKKCASIRAEVIVEDIFFKLLDNRTIFNNVTLLVRG
jgi:uncharacterized repeat protein (TIGR01451 family)